jgi:transcriptional regulator with XRE-family HTH domain
MSREFSDILRGLMENRGLAPGPVSYASARARSTITQLLNGRIEPTAQLLADIAPVMQMPLASYPSVSTTPPGCTWRVALPTSSYDVVMVRSDNHPSTTNITAIPAGTPKDVTAAVQNLVTRAATQAAK